MPKSKSGESSKRRIQFIENLEEIKALLKEGRSLKDIYNKLVDDGKIHMNYRMFQYYSKSESKRERKPIVTKSTQEFIDCKSDIIDMVNKGYSFIDIYNKLVADGRFSTQLDNFYRLIKQEGIKKVKISKLLKNGNRHKNKK